MQLKHFLCRHAISLSPGQFVTGTCTSVATIYCGFSGGRLFTSLDKMGRKIDKKDRLVVPQQ